MLWSEVTEVREERFPSGDFFRFEASLVLVLILPCHLRVITTSSLQKVSLTLGAMVWVATSPLVNIYALCSLKNLLRPVNMELALCNSLPPLSDLQRVDRSNICAMLTGDTKRYEVLCWVQELAWAMHFRGQGARESLALGTEQNSAMTGANWAFLKWYTKREIVGGVFAQQLVRKRRGPLRWGSCFMCGWHRAKGVLEMFTGVLWYAAFHHQSPGLCALGS